MVDTGAESATFDISFLPILGPKRKTVKATTPDGIISIDLYDTPSARVGDFPLPKRGLVDVTDLRRDREIIGYDIDGIIGMDFLSQYVCRIDFDNGRFQFLESADTKMGARVPLMFKRRVVPYIPCSIPGYGRLEFQIDTGFTASSGGLAPDVFDLFAKQGLIGNVGNVRTYSAAGEARKQYGVAKALSIDAFLHKDIRLAESSYNILGLPYLARFVVTFDFPNGNMYLEKGRQFHLADRNDASGLHFVRRRGEIEVVAVDGNSPAQKAGFKIGDVVLKIGDLDARTTTLFELRRELCEEGGEVRVVFLRRRVQGDVVLKLAMRIANP